MQPSPLSIRFALPCRQHKLCLVLDLDHTLINSAHTPDIEPSTLAALQERLRAEAAQPEAARTLYHLPAVAMWTKLRPGARAFLAKAAALFQLWIHTNARRCCRDATMCLCMH